MKQLTQSIRRGTMDVLDVPFPQLRGPGALVDTRASLISAGTERATVEFARASLLAKAHSRPDLVQQVVEKVRREGFTQALSTVLSRLERPIAPGYAGAGTLLALSPDVSELVVGDRVACAGAGYATHAQVNYVPRNLLVPIPRRASGEWVGFDEASFTTLGAIALHGVRLAKPELGDRALVIGLGLIGLLAVQILRANGCKVMGVDLNPGRCALARELGAEIASTPAEAESVVAAWSDRFGADLVVVAAATDRSDPAVLAAELARDKGRIVAIGATGLDLPRRTLYHKELSLVVSRSYGPGRYDPEYEERGRSYPLAHVRWTERENMRAFLDLVANGSVDVRRLISHRFPIDDAEQAYETLEREAVLGIVLEYPEAPQATGPIHLASSAPASQKTSSSTAVGVSLIGAGNFANGVLLPAICRSGAASLRGVVTATGLSARAAGDKHGFAYCTTSADDVWGDERTNAVVIATRHDAHAQLAVAALETGKAVFVEKPLCLSELELDSIVSTVGRLRTARSSPVLMVGFNRRFAPSTRQIRAHFAKTQGPVNVIYRVNAGRVPPSSWVASAEEGGGRILGEVCHFVDLCAYLAGAPVHEVSAVRSSASADDVIVTLRMAGGSIATIAYLVEGDRSAPKERIEVFGSGTIATIDDFRTATLSTGGRSRRLSKLFATQDKGHRAGMQAFLEAVATGGDSPIPFEAAVNSTRATFAILRSLETGQPVAVHP
jgi:predicted dehydrogenase/threonine dehydrogenase-like Zn-dependent dehydrogenase